MHTSCYWGLRITLCYYMTEICRPKDLRLGPFSICHFLSNFRTHKTFILNGSYYFEVLKSWPRGRVATITIIVNFNRGSRAAWPQPLKTLITTLITPVWSPLKTFKELIIMWNIFIFILIFQINLKFNIFSSILNILGFIYIGSLAPLLEACYMQSL